MKKEMKTLCKVKKSRHEEYRAEIVKAVSRPKYICKKCLRAASKKEFLCSPCSIEKWRH